MMPLVLLKDPLAALRRMDYRDPKERQESQRILIYCCITTITDDGLSYFWGLTGPGWWLLLRVWQFHSWWPGPSSSEGSLSFMSSS